MGGKNNNFDDLNNSFIKGGKQKSFLKGIIFTLHLNDHTPVLLMYNDCSIAELQHLIATHSDEKAYAELFGRFAGRLQQFANSMVQCPEAAEEMVSDVFIRVWERRRNLDQVGNLRMYLYVSVRNYSVNYLRKLKQHVNISLEDLPVNTLPLTDPNPYQLAEIRQLQQRIQQAVAGLPPKCGLIFKLAKEDDLRQKEIAELLHLSPKTVENQMTIALRKLGLSIQHLTERVIRLRS